MAQQINSSIFVLKISYMKHIIFLTLFTIITSLLFSQTANVTVKIKGIQEVKGTMNFAVYDNAENYSKSKNYYAGESIKIASAIFEYVFKDIPNGIYAISLFQDEDENGELNTNWIGMPKELFGFSNDAKGRMGPPSFEDASFIVKEDMEIIINLVDL